MHVLKELLQLGDVTLRAILSLITLFLVTKLLGKKQVSELSLFDYVIGISIGNFAAEMTINLESEYLHGILAVILFGLVAYFVSVLTMKSFRLRSFFMGKPTVLIQDGKMLIDGLRKVRFDVNDLLEECRINGFFDVSQIAYAVMESNGQISFLPKTEYRSVTLGDMNIKGSSEGLCANVIIDGHLMEGAIKSAGVDEKWIMHELELKGKKLSDILLATVDINKKIVFFEKNKGAKIMDVLE